MFDLKKWQIKLRKFNILRKKGPGGPPFALPQTISGTLHQTVLMIERLAENRHYSFALASCQHGAGNDFTDLEPGPNFFGNHRQRNSDC